MTLFNTLIRLKFILKVRVLLEKDHVTRFLFEGGLSSVLNYFYENNGKTDLKKYLNYNVRLIDVDEDGTIELTINEGVEE